VRLGGKRPQISRQREFPLRGRDEVPRAARSADAPTATHGNERAEASALMERLRERASVQAALKRVRKSEGSAGLDGMTVDESPAHGKTHWPVLREHSRGQVSTSRRRCEGMRSRRMRAGQFGELGVPPEPLGG